MGSTVFEQRLFMVNKAACHSPEVLLQLLLGQLSDQETEPLARHLESCATCAEAARTLTAEDDLVRAARAGPACLALSAPLRQLMERLRDLRPPASAPAPTQTAASGDTP